ncbi:Copper-exporting P-type ATPase A [Symbiodinium microadriaticum]|uniref:Copper-exporting P-type ATPase A n=1 Tax=Symbiodinium microadriaticum TaxID=2951 RepID=A0A1Q9F726_SYMMI|nr:Copper-exporting P-type ATPase A [Symbiodinium microadriaticum]CAE7424784.1 copA [Symbiodinium microadriaticum]
MLAPLPVQLIWQIADEKRSVRTELPEQLNPRDLVSSLQKQGFAIEPAEAGDVQATAGDRSLLGDLRCALPPTLLILTVVFLLPLTGSSQLLRFSCGIPGLHAETLLLFALSTPVQCCAAKRFHQAARRALKRRSPNMDVLISTATCLAYGYSTFMMALAIVFAICGETQEEPPPHFFETPCTLVTVVLIGRLLESGAKQRTTTSLDELVRTSPPKARLVSEDAKEPRDVATELVALEDLLEVWPSEVVPADGELSGWTVDGGLVSAAFDESLLTGESRPVPKAVGDTLIGGSRLVTGRAVRLRAKRVGSGTALQQIVSLVERAAASAGAAPAQRLADAAARSRFIPARSPSLIEVNSLVQIQSRDKNNIYIIGHAAFGQGLMQLERYEFEDCAVESLNAPTGVRLTST